jgi:hypothetical protein
MHRKVFVDAMVAEFVGIGQRASRDAAANSQTEQFRRGGAQTALDVPKTLAIGNLGKGHAKELIAA